MTPSNSIAIVRHKVSAWGLEAAAVLLLLATGWGYLEWVERRTLAKLETVLAQEQLAGRRQLEGWMRDRVAQAQSWVMRGDVQALTRELLARRNAPATELAKLPALAALRAEFGQYQGRQGTPGFFIVSPEGRNLASVVNDNLGMRNLTWDEPEFVRAIRLKGAALSPLMQSDVPLENVGAVLDDKPMTLFVGVPIRIEGDAPAAYFLLRLNPASLLAQQGGTRFGVSGISYLVDQFGRLHADRAWINMDLAESGLHSEAFRGRSYLFARDPGHNLFDPAPGATHGAREGLPLTQSARQLQVGDGQSLEPYRDHRGVRVVGGWRWSDTLGLGVVTELSADEAFAPLTEARQHVLVVAFVLVGAVVLLLFWRLRESRRLMQEAMLRAEAASRAKGVFLANMSHEIRTPLNAVLGIAHLLSTTPLAPTQREYLDIISNSGQTLLGILNDILDYSKVEAGKLELATAEFSLHGLIDTLASIMSINAAPKDLELIVGIEPDVPSQLIGDSHRLLQILINLTGNAIKFTAQGEVVVHVRREPCAEVPGAEPQVRVRFEVQDSGVGIPPEKTAQLFAPFVQADAQVARSFGGTGLGLAICKRLVELMQGEIGVDSTEGQGSRFWFVVPMRVAAEPERTAAKLPGQISRALVVDDNPMAREFVSKSVDRLGWNATEVESGAAAIVELSDRHQREAEDFDVLLIDWKMPGMDGLETSRAVRAIEGMAQPPIVIMVTAFGREQVMKSGGADLIDAVISKPATPSKILDAVMEAQAKRHPGLPAAGPGYAPARVVNRLKGLRILLVEDNFINQQVARGVLSAEGALVSTVDHGQAAIDALVRHPAAFDLVLMDVQMPVMDGLEATRRLRREHGLSLPIVAMSAGVMAEERALCAEAGMNGFIPKPLEPKVVVQIIRSLKLRPAAAPVAARPGGADDEPPASGSALAIDGLDVAELEVALNGNRAAVTRLLDRMEHECTQAVADLERSLSAADWVEFAAVVHGFKGVAANMRARALAKEAEALEAALREGDGTALGRLFPPFRDQVLALRDRLQEARAPAM